MNRKMAGLLGASLSCVMLLGSNPAGAQENASPTTVVEVAQWDWDNLRSGTNRDGVETARGEDGDTITYTAVDNPESTSGDATTVDSTGILTAPDLSRVPVEATETETTLAPPSGEPASAPVETAPSGGVAGDATMSDPASEGTPLVATCADFATWYDSQIFYESAGAVSAVPELVASLDSDVDGVACEEMMQLS